jgi:hypothetical protein
MPSEIRMLRGEALVWAKARKVDEETRLDAHGHPMAWSAYGNQSDSSGWAVFRIDPNGGDEWENLRPLSFRSLPAH